jgi:hypothetical protein
MTLALMIVGWLVTLLVAAEACRRAPPKLMAVFWFVAPLALLPLWLSTSLEHDWPGFLWVKAFSVTLGVTWISVCRGWADRLPAWAIRWPIFLILVVNVLEAVGQDLREGTVLNAIAGMLLVLTVAPPSRIEVAPEGLRDLRFHLGVPWILAYGVWNAALLYGSFEGIVFGHHVAILGAALAIAIATGWSNWFQARAFTLGVHMVAYCTFYLPLREGFNTGALYSDAMRDRVHVASLVFVSCLLGYEVLRRWRQGRAASAAI